MIYSTLILVLIVSGIIILRLKEDEVSQSSPAIPPIIKKRVIRRKPMGTKAPLAHNDVQE